MMQDENKEIGKILKEALKDYKKQPSERVWNAIEESNALIPNQSAGSWPYTKAIIGSLAIVIIALVAFYLTKPIEKPDNEIVADQTIVNQKETIVNKTITEINIPVNDQETDNNTSSSDQKIEIVENQVTVNPETHIDIPEGKIDESIEPQEVLNESMSNNNQKQQLRTKQSNNIVSGNVDSYSQGNIVQPPAEINSGLSNSVITFSPDQNICNGDKVKIFAAGGLDYLWSTGDMDDTLLISPELTKVYRVTVTDNTGKQHIGKVRITVVNCAPLFVPSAFTPDGDGLNDVFKPVGTNVIEFSMKIISRTGFVVFESNDLNNGWDGRIKGNYGPTGVYLYQIRYIDEMEKAYSINGQIYLHR
ncbi:gliding motility-associated C-terminal domain-containing protein [Bacteroidota bacterium]